MRLALGYALSGDDPLRHGNAASRQTHPGQGSVALVTTVQQGRLSGVWRTGVNAASSFSTPGSKAIPSVSSISIFSMILFSVSGSRSGRSLATVSMLRQP